jgi:hypothetical protein
MKRSLPYIYFVVNLACAHMVLHAGYRVSAFMALEQRDYVDFGDSLSFIMEGGPAMLLGLLTSLVWAGWTLTDASRRSSYQPMVWLGSVAGVWVLAIIGIRLFQSCG